jgi:hypothetical protein
VPQPIPRAARSAALTRPAVIAAGLALLHLLLAGVAFNPTPHMGGDGGTYMALAQSLLQGRGYVDLWDPARPPHTQFPPVFPAIVALATLLGLGSWVGIKVVVLAFSCVAVAACWLWLRHVTTPRLALLVGVVLAAASGILDLSHWELSDIPFWLFTTLALWAFARFDGEAASKDPPAASAGRVDAAPAGSASEARGAKADRTKVRGADRPAAARPGVAREGGRGGSATHPAPFEAAGDRGQTHALRWLVLAAALAALADLTRSAGLPLVLAAGIWLLWRHGWRRAAIYAAVAGPGIFAWWLWGHASGGGYTGYLWYVDPYQPAAGTVTALDMVQRIGRNAAKYAVDHVPMLLVGVELGPVLGGLAGSAVLVLGALGWAGRLRRAGLAEIWLPLYAGVLLLWPLTWSGERLVLPILPLLLVYAGEVIRDALAHAGARRRGASMALAAAVVLAMVPGIAGVVRVGITCTAEYADGDRFACLDREFADFMNLSASLRGRLPAGTVVLSRKPTMFYAMAGYPSRVYPLTADPDSFFRAAAAIHARYVVVDHIADLSPLYLQPVLLARRNDFCVIPDPYLETAALARIDPGGPPPSANAPPNAFRTCRLPQVAP